MRGLRIAAALVALLASQSALPQALPTATGPGTSLVLGGEISEVRTDYGSQTIAGGAVFVDSNLYWRYGLETEGRIANYPKFGERQTTLLVGPRWVFSAKRLEPYAKLLIGGGRFDFPYGYGWGDYFVVAPGVGVDLKLRHNMRLRLADVEYQDWQGFTYGDIHPFSISAGLSFQLVGTKWEFNRYLAK